MTLPAPLNVVRCSPGPTAVMQALQAAMPEYKVMGCPEDQVMDYVRDADVVIPARASINAQVLVAAPRCKLIQQMGTGLDRVDLKAATALNIPVANIPSNLSGTSQSVAEMALWLMLAVLRQQPALAAAVREANWKQLPLGRTLHECTVGIVGMGEIGSALARLLQPFGCRVLGVKRQPSEDLRQQLGLDWLGSMQDLPTLLAQVNMLVLTLPLTPETQGLIGADQLNAMPRGSYLVNVSRGGLTEKSALLESFAGGHLAGAGLDVFWDEPADSADPIFQYNTVVTPHAAGYTTLMVQTASRLIAQNIQRAFTGQPVLYRKN